jgi:citronellol/citronellal dehydrogenase
MTRLISSCALLISGEEQSVKRNGRTLNGRTVFVTGGSRGIGLAIAKRCAADGANLVIAAKTAEANPKLPGTIHTAAAEIEAAGGACLPLQADIRDERQVTAAVAAAVERFGGIDVVVNNASAISLTNTGATPIRRFDLMMSVNARGTYLVTQACLPHLERSAAAGRNPHVLTLSPPLNMDAKWFAPHLAYTMAKYGMSMCVLGHAEEFRPLGIAVNALWPRTAIDTAALRMIPGIEPAHCRTAGIMADAAYAVLTSDGAATTGNFFIDDEVLSAAGITDFDRYSVVPGSRTLMPDLFL